jgi:hypothetical protein
MTKGEYQNIMDQYGDWQIVKMRVGRKPLDSYAEKFAQGAQAVGNVFSYSKKPHVDKFFHTYAEFALKHKTTGAKQVLLLEKNQTLKALDGRMGGLQPDHDAINIDVSKIKGRTLQEYEDHHIRHHTKVLGKKYEHYAVRQNNCQVWQTSGLEGNGLRTAATDDFINQPIEEVIPKWFGDFLQPLTDLRARVDLATDAIGSWFSGTKKTPILEHIQKPKTAQELTFV